MPSVHQLKKRYFRRQWFSSEQKLALDDGRVEIWPMRRHGLAYDDHRAHSGIRWPAHGKRALQEMPFDELHMDRKVWKKKEKISRKSVNARVRELRKEKQPFMERMSFKEALAMWWLWGLGEIDEVIRIQHFGALNNKYLVKKGVLRKGQLAVLKKDGKIVGFDFTKMDKVFAWGDEKGPPVSEDGILIQASHQFDFKLYEAQKAT